MEIYQLRAFVVIDYHGTEESELGILEVRTMKKFLETEKLVAKLNK